MATQKSINGAATAKKPRTRRSKPAVVAPAVAPRPHEQDVMNRLRRVEGQVRGVLAMMEQGLPCETIAQQLAAARKALDRAFYEMMACSLEMEITESADNSELCNRISEKTRLLAKYA
jgi:CsoR family transcriptional regulator, copper-sensing transcriptional repressor